MRKALSNIGGSVTKTGSSNLSELLARAFDEASRTDPNLLNHGIHPYAGRMHWIIARTLITELDVPNPAILDPFCGSGTTLLEAAIAGRPSLGVDIHPLALRIAHVKTLSTTEEQRKRALKVFHEVTERSLERVRERVSPKVPVSQAERRWYGPHVLLELSGLFDEIHKVGNPMLERVLEIVFSSILVKFSKQRADTSQDMVEKRIRKGLVSEFFLRKGHQLVEAWGEAEKLARGRYAEPELLQCDIRFLANKLHRRYREVGLIITSPPYGATYNYSQHHARSQAWLRLADRAWAEHELGSRREVSELGLKVWDEQLFRTLSAISDCIHRDGSVVMVIGDAELRGRRIPADEHVEHLANQVGLQVIAKAAQPRPNWISRLPRHEHLLLLRSKKKK